MTTRREFIRTAAATAAATALREPRGRDQGDEHRRQNQAGDHSPPPRDPRPPRPPDAWKKPAMKAKASLAFDCCAGLSVA